MLFIPENLGVTLCSRCLCCKIGINFRVAVKCFSHKLIAGRGRNIFTYRGGWAQRHSSSPSFRIL